MRSRWLLTLLAGGLFCAVVWHTIVDAESPSRTRTTEAKIDTTAIEKKLEQVLENQQTMLKRFDEVLEELKVIKIRATR